MKNLSVVLALVLVVGAGSAAKAQSMGSEYKTALGVKFYPGAITLKHFYQDNKAVEGLLSFWRYGARITVLHEWHGDINNARGLKWYAGGGAHLGFWNSDWKDRYPGRDHGVQLGIDGVVGLDYKFTDAPINLSLDWQPSFNIAGYSYFEGSWVGLAIRYTF